MTRCDLATLELLENIEKLEEAKAVLQAKFPEGGSYNPTYASLAIMADSAVASLEVAIASLRKANHQCLKIKADCNLLD